jgi:hypothetical protein
MEFLYKCNVLQSLFTRFIAPQTDFAACKIAMFHSYFFFFSNLSSNLPLFALDSSGKPAIPMKRSESGRGLGRIVDPS